MLLGCLTTRLLDKVLIEINSCDLRLGDEASDQWNFNHDVLTFAHSIRGIPKHLFTCFSTHFFRLVTEETHLHVVYFDFWDDSTRTLQVEWSDLGASVVGDT